MIKIHRLLVEAIIECIHSIFVEGKYADRAIERVLKQNRKWGSRDRGFVADYTYDFVRWWRLLDFVSDTNTRMDKGSLWRMFASLHLIKGYELPVWSEFKQLDPKEIFKRYELAKKNLPIWESVPDWLFDLGNKELKENWIPELHALNQQAPLVIRVNEIKTSKERLLSKFIKLEIATVPVKQAVSALIIKKRMNLFSLAEFREGLFEVQDASSQQVGEFLSPEPGMRVIDACAGAGGKTLHLAALMKNKGRIIAMDTEQWKLDELMRRAKRAGAGNIEARLIETGKTIKRLEGSADALLLDVPCSGLGVLRRNPDAKWKLRPEFMDEVRQTQAQILSTYSSMLKAGGKMVYATCSILPSENENQVKKFLEEHPGFKLIKEQHLSATLGFDGFYMALIKRD